jgi:hypothetical protein
MYDLKWVNGIFNKLKLLTVDIKLLSSESYD